MSLCVAAVFDWSLITLRPPKDPQNISAVKADSEP